MRLVRVRSPWGISILSVHAAGDVRVYSTGYRLALNMDAAGVIVHHTGEISMV